MADFSLGGLLGGGGGLYDDLLTPQQQSQLSSRGLLAMAGAFADAGMPSRLPIPLGAAIGKAAAAMGTGRDQAALQVLQAQKMSQEVQSMKMQAGLQQQMLDDMRKLPLDQLLKLIHPGGVPGVGIPAGATSAAPAGAGSGAVPPGAFSAVPALAAQGAAADTPAPDGAAFPSLIPPRRDLSRYGLGPGAGLMDPAPPQAAAAAPDTVLPRGGGPGGLLTLASYNGAAAPGGGNAWLNANAPFPTLQRPGGVPIQWTNNPAPSGVPFGQDPGDSLPGGGAGTPPFGADGEPTRLAASAETPSNRDIVLPSGRGVPANMLRQVADNGFSGGGAAPGASGGAPTPPVPPGVDPQAMNTLLLELAKRNAMAEILKLGNPYGSMLNVLQGSPAYKGQIAGAEAGARYPFDTGLATWKAALDAANEEKKQKLTTLNTLTKTMVPDGKGGVVEVNATVAQAIDIAHGLPVPELGFKGMFSAGGAGATGGPVGTPIYTPQETARQQAAGGAPYATKDITLTWPDGETRKVTLTGEQAKDVAEGKPVPAIGWPGTTGGAGTAGGTPGAAGASGGARVGEVVYPPGYDKATEVMLTQRRPKAEAAVQSLNFNETAQRLLDAGVITGWGAQLRLDVAKAKALFGWSNDKIANTEAFVSTQARQVAASLASGAFGSGSSITDNDRAYAARMAGADSNLDEASLRFLLRQNNTAARWEIDKYNADVKRHDPKGQLPILRVDEGPKAEVKPSGNQPTPIGGSQLNGKPYIKWSDGKWRPEGELPGQEK